MLTSLGEWIEANPNAAKVGAILAVAVTALGAAILGLGIALKAASFALGGYSGLVSAASLVTGLFRGRLIGLRLQLLLLDVLQAKASACRGNGYGMRR